MRVQIITCNTKRENGKYKDSYHEIHEIDNLRSVEHLIATIDSVISNNQLFKDINDTLDSIIVSGNDTNILNMVIDHYNKYKSSVPIMSAETAMLTL